MNKIKISKLWLVIIGIVFLFLVSNLIYLSNEIKNQDIVRASFFAEDISTGESLRVFIVESGLTKGKTIFYDTVTDDQQRPGRSITGLELSSPVRIDAEGYEPIEVEINPNKSEAYYVRLKKKEL